MKRIFLILIFLLILPVVSEAERDAIMRVHFIDVGQGDSILIETPEKQNILIDGGEPEAGSRLVSYLEELNIEEIDLLIATHPDIDHIGGLNKILKRFPVKQLIDNGQLHFTKTYVKYRVLLSKEKIPIQVARENQQISIEESLDIHVLNTGNFMKTNNDSSIVLKLGYNEIDFLFMSDVETEQENKIAHKYDVTSDILKVAHHGSNTSSSLEFLKKVEPETAIISYSGDNDYGHPGERVIENLRKLRAEIYSTAAFGNIIVETDGESYIILPELFPMEKIIRKYS